MAPARLHLVERDLDDDLRDDEPRYTEAEWRQRNITVQR